MTVMLYPQITMMWALSQRTFLLRWLSSGLRAQDSHEVNRF